MATGFNDSVHLLRQFSKQISTEGDNKHLFSDELELLQNVYFDDLQLVDSYNTELLVHINPSTAEDKDRQFVYCDLSITVDEKYPSSLPELSIKQSRGLSDAHLKSICEGICHLSLENVGSPMIYDLVEYVRDCLTDNNKPCGKCTLCQYEFQEDDQFLRTECYHYFHPLCFSHYVNLHSETIKEQKESRHVPGATKPHPQLLECPVCRVAIINSDPCLSMIPSLPVDEELYYSVQFVPDDKLRQWQGEMAVLYQKQLEKGGIIDLTVQHATIDETWVSSVLTSAADDVTSSTVYEEPVTATTTSSTEYEKPQDNVTSSFATDKLPVDNSKTTKKSYSTKTGFHHHENRCRGRGGYHGNSRHGNQHSRQEVREERNWKREDNNDRYQPGRKAKVIYSDDYRSGETRRRGKSSGGYRQYGNRSERHRNEAKSVNSRQDITRGEPERAKEKSET